MLALAYRHRAGPAALALVALVAVVWLVTGGGLGPGGSAASMPLLARGRCPPAAAGQSRRLVPTLPELVHLRATERR